jgi:hypothetical protein
MKRIQQVARYEGFGWFTVLMQQLSDALQKPAVLSGLFLLVMFATLYRAWIAYYDITYMVVGMLSTVGFMLFAFAARKR